MKDESPNPESPMTTAVAERNMAVASRPLLMRDTIQAESDQRDLLKQYVETQMVEKSDFGVIPGTDRKTLLKPGAEKLTSLFRCTARFDLVEVIRDFDRPLFYYEIRCQIISLDSGAVVAEGYGSANSMEGKWRWRKAARKCPSCGKEAIIKGKAEYGGGWVCFKKKDGCGAKWPDGAQDIESQVAGKVINEDIATEFNTILKIAKKRSHVDAAITLARCSDLFTQDIEEREDMGDTEDPKGTPLNQQPEPAQKPPDLTPMRNKLRALIGQLAELKHLEPDAVYEKLLGLVRTKFPDSPNTTSEWPHDTLQFAVYSAEKSIATAQANGKPEPVTVPATTTEDASVPEEDRIPF